MLMFKCADCGAEFEDPQIVSNGGGDVGEDAYQCPECGSFYFNSADKCEICGKLYVREDSTYESWVVCDECLERVVKKAMKVLEDNMGKKELEAFYDFYDTIGGDFVFDAEEEG